MNHRINMLLLQKKITGKQIRLNLKPNYRKTLNKKFIFYNIAGFLDDTDIYELCKTCSSMNKLIRGNTETENKFLKGQVKKIKKYVFKKYIEQKKENVSLNSISKELCLPETIFNQEKVKYYNRVGQIYQKMNNIKVKKSSRVSKAGGHIPQQKENKVKNTAKNVSKDKSKISEDFMKNIPVQNQGINDEINSFKTNTNTNSIKILDQTSKNVTQLQNVSDIYVNYIKGKIFKIRNF